MAAERALDTAKASLADQRRATRVLMREYVDARLPNVVITAIDLDDDWQEVFDGAQELPITFTTKNIGGGTARDVLLDIKEVQIWTWDDKLVGATSAQIALAPLRPDVERQEFMKVGSNGSFGHAHRIVAAGIIQAAGDIPLAGAERFVWSSADHHRGSGSLVERHPSEYEWQDEDKPASGESPPPALPPPGVG